MVLIDPIDTIFCKIREIDSDLANDFANRAKKDLNDLLEQIDRRLIDLINEYTVQYADNEELVIDRLVKLRTRRKRRAKTAA